ncbi:acetolactate synthase, putative [Talaromyces stipitatus ATCC 10500]|uniref:Acetolactate synthase, putative n=1 Tax=Talaromyces stipitatus (strain ATCC 10500 / CBS 375.48 / QM 6759 / NRRL 1006) TaxID=441959 RepID=B8MMI4_TALSN|nr:acetolactate synthase, putative [Talaromyces stipitatus ATCC 10500]EED13738.1 acetolactate synthase, putative [Talaromyces stipitatus ATCC 10500]
MSETASKYIVADAFLEALAEARVDYLFTVLGSDHPSIIEAYVRRTKLQGKEFPRMILFQHEFAAMSAADGYARITHRPACVIVHVDVGTAALGQGLHNASSGRAPVVIFAGVAPSTLHGESAGSRSEHVQWYQDIPNQASLVAPYSRYTAEIKSAQHVQTVVHRAVLMATTGSPGPVYITATREMLAQAVESLQPRKRATIPSCRIGGLSTDAVELVAEALIKAEGPLVITGYLGRNHQAVKNLIALVDTIKGIRVFDSEIREVCFPADHPAWVTRGTGAAKVVQNADVILVLDADVPWIPTRVRPSPEAQIFHIDLDPRKEKMNLFDIGATATFHADSATVLSQLTDYISKSGKVSADTYAERWNAVQASYKESQILVVTRALRAAETPEAPSTVDYLLHTLRSVVPDDTFFVSDSVTNQVLLNEQLRFTRPGSHLTKGGSGLGWAGGAAIGVKLATRLYDLTDRPDVKCKTSTDQAEEPLVCMITGDGSFVFSVPTAVYWASHRHNCPFLTIILNNGGWRATRQCIVDVHPQGVASTVTNQELGISLELDGPNYGEVAKAAANGHLWTKRVTRVADLQNVLIEAKKVVLEQKISAVVDVIVK